MSYFFIINPRAGKSSAARLTGKIREFFEGRGLRCELAVTSGKGHGLELSRRALIAGFSTVVAAGGDGTIREAAEPLIGKAARLGILPLGSGNGLARNLYMPLDLASALKGLLDWPVRKIDVGLANGKPFFCSAGVGLDAEVARAFNSREGGRRGILPYVYHAALAFLRYSPAKVSVLMNGRRLEYRPMVAVVMNGQQYGGGAKAAPEAYIDDGLLNLVVIKKAGVFRTLRAAPDLFNGRLNRHADLVSTETGSLLEINFPPDAAYHLDGEDFTGDGVLRISVLHRALSVIAPK